jgi:hypothetical protein
MVNTREPEIRNNTLQLVIDAHLMARRLKSPKMRPLGSQLVDAAFLVSSGVANAFSTLLDAQFAQELENALLAMTTMNKCLGQIEPLAGHLDIQDLQRLISDIQEELIRVLADTAGMNADYLNPKLDKVCI